MKKYEHAFGKNDIRGIYGDDITEELYYNTGRGFVDWLKKESGISEADMWITITIDARTHSPSLEKALSDGITSTGANVVKLGLAPTPIGYYSEVAGLPKDITDGKNVIAAAIITASHNPKEYNGLKMTYAKRTLSESQIAEVKEHTFKEMKFPSEPSIPQGQIKEYNIIPDYIKEMKEKFGQIGKGIKVVVDSANATGGVVGPQLYKELGCDVIELFSEPDGNFPNHHPNPSVEKTLDTLKEVVVENKADIGIAYDGDSDRIGIVDQNGKFLTGDKLLLIYATDLIEDCKNNGTCPTVVSEVKCSQVLYDTINKLGGQAVMCKTGHGYIKDKMKETNALLAGEMSGHTFFKDRYYGFDDAIYAGCRIIEIIANHKKINPDFKISDMLKPFDEVCSSEEVRFPCPNELKKSTLEKVKQCVEEDKNLFGSEIKEIITLDGMRIVFDGGFALIRQSNTEPVFTLRFEAKNKEECDRFKSCMINTLENILK
ncbi:TPA: phosphomannomutase/phosphoglucomutase [Candidatus Gastranaerophilales bacterium HUM_20]|nr:phosphomannomutase/phosphoglucomutase [Clostridium sp. CAG:729]DAB18416.1 MAG TPA: phosphomannomutase/phosphoglucomutase [Candidatus Gastranaerophilales bacterium HUM_20]